MPSDERDEAAASYAASWVVQSALEATHLKEALIGEEGQLAPEEMVRFGIGRLAAVEDRRELELADELALREALGDAFLALQSDSSALHTYSEGLASVTESFPGGTLHGEIEERFVGLVAGFQASAQRLALGGERLPNARLEDVVTYVDKVRAAASTPIRAAELDSSVVAVTDALIGSDDAGEQESKATRRGLLDRCNRAIGALGGTPTGAQPAEVDMTEGHRRLLDKIVLQRAFILLKLGADDEIERALMDVVSVRGSAEVDSPEHAFADHLFGMALSETARLRGRLMSLEPSRRDMAVIKRVIGPSAGATEPVGRMVGRLSSALRGGLAAVRRRA